jgi:hypothetical protein
VPSKTDQFASDPIQTHATALASALSKLPPGKVPPLAEPTITRTRKFSARLSELLSTADPELIDFPSLSQSSQHLANLPPWIDAFATGSDNSSSIEQYLDIAIRALPVLMAASPVANGKAAVIVASVKRESDVLFDGVRKQVEGVQVQVANMMTAAEGVKAEHASLAVKNAQNEEANQRAITEFRSLLDTEKLAVFDKFHSDAESKLAQLSADADASTAASLKASQAQHETAERILADLKKLEEEVKATASSVGDRVLTGDYGTHAEKERKTANKLRWLAGFSFFAGAGFAVWASIVASQEPGITWQRLAAKLATTAIFAGLGGYLASQSAEHRHEERKVRRRFLDLKALGPFIALLPNNKQEEIRDALAQRAFFEPEPLPVARSPRRGVSVDDITKLVPLFRDSPKP